MILQDLKLSWLPAPPEPHPYQHSSLLNSIYTHQLLYPYPQSCPLIHLFKMSPSEEIPPNNEFSVADALFDGNRDDLDVGPDFANQMHGLLGQENSVFQNEVLAASREEYGAAPDSQFPVSVNQSISAPVAGFNFHCPDQFNDFNDAIDTSIPVIRPGNFEAQMNNVFGGTRDLIDTFVSTDELEYDFSQSSGFVESHVFLETNSSMLPTTNNANINSTFGGNMANVDEPVLPSVEKSPLHSASTNNNVVTPGSSQTASPPMPRCEGASNSGVEQSPLGNIAPHSTHDSSSRPAFGVHTPASTPSVTLREGISSPFAAPVAAPVASVASPAVRAYASTTLQQPAPKQVPHIGVTNQCGDQFVAPNGQNIDLNTNFDNQFPAPTSQAVAFLPPRFSPKDGTPRSFDEMLRKYTTTSQDRFIFVDDMLKPGNIEKWISLQGWLQMFTYNKLIGLIVELKSGGFAWAGDASPKHHISHYKYPPVANPECDFDVTSYHHENDLSTQNDVNLPLPCAFIDDVRMKIDYPNTAPIELKGKNGKPVRAPGGQVILDYSVLPRWISSAVEGWRMHYWMIMDPRLEYSDIIARMSFECTEEGGEGPLSGGIDVFSIELERRVQQFRAHHGILNPLEDRNMDNYDVTLQDRKAISKLTKIQLEYGVWWTIDEQRGIMYPPKPDDPNVPYNYDFYLLPVKQGMSERVKKIMGEVNCRKQTPVKLLDPVLTASEYSPYPALTTPAVSKSSATLMATTSEEVPVPSPFGTPKGRRAPAPPSTPPSTGSQKRARGASTACTPGPKRQRASPKTPPTGKVRANNALMRTPPGPGSLSEKDLEAFRAQHTGLIAKLWSDRTPPEEQRRAREAVLAEDHSAACRSVKATFGLKFMDLTQQEKANLLLPLFDGEHPLEAEKNRTAQGSNYGAQRQREALEKAMRLNGEAAQEIAQKKLKKK